MTDFKFVVSLSIPNALSGLSVNRGSMRKEKPLMILNNHQINAVLYIINRYKALQALPHLNPWSDLDRGWVLEVPEYRCAFITSRTDTEIQGLYLTEDFVVQYFHLIDGGDPSLVPDPILKAIGYRR